MSDGTRPARFLTLLVILLLLGSIGGVAWWLKRPAAPAADAHPVEDPDVFCSGRVDAAGQVVALEPGQAGRVTEVLVAEGDSVVKGQDILRLDAATADARVAQAEAAVEGAQVDLDSALRDKERVPKQLEARATLVAAAGARVEAARKALQQRREQQQLTPLGRAEGEALDAQVRELELLEAAEREQLEDLKKIDPELRVRAARARLKAAGADRLLAAKARAECVLAAPMDGVVLRLQATPGGIVSPGSPFPAVTFAPAGPLVIRAEVDQESLGRVAKGMRAEAQDENRPDGPVWAGHVRNVSRWVAPRRTQVLEPGEISDVRTVECVIELDPAPAGRGEALVIGQRMRVRIVRPAAGAGPVPPKSAR
ncbi:HlyD family secretion protein [Fimbriiglobus ruber]|uniref:Putative membrane fusion protein (MFP) component of efflux pump, membrane anchor protein YbhG n=1 Tax=Fimbriiglobus ruber TaxID=1908690 RepID=A0A225E8W6_9BACT|nr:HlyD family efflux transporter periplasmic adaptor subunit [Fimbriiglobus ruber]OWK46516.1 putative membrane fusion protein (MFP) component of efflux pump, membrane anchor protein YbhG [Fimbriiglobus ruber]